MLEAFGEIILQFLVEIFIPLLLEGLASAFKHIGTAFKFPFLFWRHSYSEIYKSDSNIAYGIIICLTITIIWNVCG
jgi:hypothetical protein